MLPISLDAALLKLRFPELILRPGMQVVVRVASRGEGPRGAIVLAGKLMGATLPDHVRTGDTLRLTVAETSPERVVLRLDGTQAAQPTQPQPGAQPAQAAQTLPDAAQLAPPQAPPPMVGGPVAPRPDDPEGEDDHRGTGGGRATVSLAYETPALGRLDLRLERGPEGVTVVVAAPPASAALAREHAGELRAALEGRLGTLASVRVDERRPPFDAYA